MRTKDKTNLDESEQGEEDPEEVGLEETNPEITDNFNNAKYDINKQKFHFIMTETDEMVPLPNLIEISDPYPGEPKWMRKRKGPAVLRYHKVSRDNQYERWMLKELMLYTPYREADLDDYENNTAEVYQQKESWIRSVKAKVMEHLESVEEARYMVEQANKEMDMGEVGIQMDAALEQAQADCHEEGATQHPDYIHLDRGRATEQQQT